MNNSDCHYCFDYLNRKNSELEFYSNRSHHRNLDLKINTLSDVYFLPGTKFRGGGLVQDNNYIPESYISSSAAKIYDYSVQNAEEFNGDAIYIGIFHNIWGHCLTDNLKHLWFTLDNEWMERHKSLPLVYSTIYGSSILPENFVWILSKLGITIDRLLPITAVTHFKKLIFPDQCFFHYGQEDNVCYTDEYSNLVTRIQNNIPSSSLQKVYFSRTKIKSKKDWGEIKIERAFANNGYSIFYPEQMTIEQQISIIKGASILATTEGSIAHNAVFLPLNGNLVILKKANYINGYQFLICELRKLNTTFIDIGRSTILFDKRYPYLGPFFMYVSCYLSQYLRIKKPIFPYISYFSYVLVSFCNKLIRNAKLFILRVINQ